MQGLFARPPRREKAALLAELETEFSAAGGRGVELAERIDALRAELGPKRVVARYWIAVDRMDEQDYDDRSDPEHGHNGDGQAAAEQVAKELQEAIEATGLPTCFFKVVARQLVDDEKMPLDALTTSYEDGKVSL